MPGPYAKRWGYIHPNSISMDFPEYIFLFQICGFIPDDMVIK